MLLSKPITLVLVVLVNPKRIGIIFLPVLKAAAKYGYGQAWRDPATMRPSVVYKIGSLGYGSTGPHLDLKRVDRGTSTLQVLLKLNPMKLIALLKSTSRVSGFLYLKVQQSLH
jgi:hypothetical protein